MRSPLRDLFRIRDNGIVCKTILSRHQVLAILLSNPTHVTDTLRCPGVFQHIREERASLGGCVRPQVGNKTTQGTQSA